MNEIYLIFIAGFVCLCDICSHHWSVCEDVLVPYVDVMVTVIVMHVLLFVLHVCMLRECEGEGNASEGNGGDVFVVSAGNWFRYSV